MIAPGRRWRRDDPNEPPDTVDGPPDEDVTVDDRERGARDAADRYEETLWGGA